MRYALYFAYSLMHCITLNTMCFCSSFIWFWG